MTAFSNYLETKVLGVTLCRSVFTAPTTIYAALATAISADGDTVTEVSGGSYARVVALWNAPSSGACTNNGDIVWPEATAGWGTVTHVALYDASTTGNLLYYGPLTSSQAVNTGNVFEIPNGSLSVGLD